MDDTGTQGYDSAPVFPDPCSRLMRHTLCRHAGFAGALLLIANTAVQAAPQPAQSPSAELASKKHVQRSSPTVKAAVKASGKTSHEHKLRHDKPPKHLAISKMAAPPKPAIPAELIQRINTLEEANKAMTERISMLTQNLGNLSEQHGRLQSRVDHPPPLPKPEVPAGALLLAGALGGVLGLLGSLAGKIAKTSILAGTRQAKAILDAPAPIEPSLQRQEPSVS